MQTLQSWVLLRSLIQLMSSQQLPTCDLTVCGCDSACRLLSSTPLPLPSSGHFLDESKFGGLCPVFFFHCSSKEPLSWTYVIAVTQPTNY